MTVGEVVRKGRRGGSAAVRRCGEVLRIWGVKSGCAGVLQGKEKRCVFERIGER